jgi:arylsulfatase
MAGVSLLPFLKGENTIVHDENYVTQHEHRLRLYVRKGDWKLVSIDLPVKEENFRLYNLATDLAESKDLKQEFPEVYNELLTEWHKYVEEVRIIIPK